MKIKKLILFFIFFLATNSSYANSYNWTPIAQIDGKPALGIDYSRSFKGPDGLLIVTWNDYTYMQLYVVGRPNNHPMHIYRTKVDCKNRMLLIQYNLSVEVKHFFDPKPEQYELPQQGNGSWFVPDISSSHEYLMNFICKK
jgi:hypothetical protein